MNFKGKSEARRLSGGAVRNVALVLLTFTLAACQRNPFQVIESNCPAVSVVADLGSVTRFSGAGRNAQDVALNASITGVKVDCKQGKGIDMEVSFAIVAQRGPAMNTNSVTLPYFLILMRDNHLITAKKIFETTIQFNAGADRAAVRETVTQHFSDVTSARRYDYEFLIGFQLTPDEVIYNALR